MVSAKEGLKKKNVPSFCTGKKCAVIILFIKSKNNFEGRSFDPAKNRFCSII